MTKRAGAALILLLLAALAATLWHLFERIPLAQHGHPTARPQAAAMALLERWQKSPRRLTSSI